MTTRVVIGCSAKGGYQFFAPLSALLWRERIGYEPYLILTGNWGEDSRGLVALSALDKFKFQYHVLGPSAKYSEGTMAQNCREFAAALETFADHEWLMPTDADLWPIRREFYRQHEESGARAVCYYANGDRYQTLPTCHVTMKADTWRSVYGLAVGTPIVQAVESTLDTWLESYLPKWPKWDRNFATWMSDQAIVTEKLRAQPWFASEAKMIERRGHPPADRIDRSGWPKSIDPIDRWTDAHMLRPAESDANWPRVRELWGKLLPERVAWADEYRNEYAKGI